MRKFDLATTVAACLCVLGVRGAFATPPMIDWTASYDGVDGYWDAVNDAVLRDGFLYVVGFTTVNFTRAYITIKYAPDGAEVWSRIYEGPTPIGPNQADQASAVAVDASGNVYVTGYSTEIEASVQYVDATTLKYSPTGELLWERRYRGSGGNAQPSAIVVDNRGFLYVTGGSWINQGFDVLLLKYDLDGNLLWNRTHGQPFHQASDYAFTMALDGNGDVVLGGYTQPGDLDVYILRYGPDGSLRWEWTLFGAGNVEEVIDLTLDTEGNTYALAQYAPAGRHISLLTVKLDRSGALLWSDVYSGQSTGDYAAGVELAPDGSLFVAGAAWENGSQNAMSLLKYTASGQRLWSRSERGGYYSAECNDLTVDANGAAYMTGFAFDENGREDYLTTKHDGSGNLIWSAVGQAPEGQSDIAHVVRVGVDYRVYVVGDAWRGYDKYYDITSFVYRQNETTGIAMPDPRARPRLVLAPNPVRAGNLVTALGIGTAAVEVFGVDGRRILKNEGGVPFGPLSSGVFLVKAGRETQKLVVIGK